VIQSLPLMLLEIIGADTCISLAVWRYESSLPVEMAGAYSKLQLDPQRDPDCEGTVIHSSLSPDSLNLAEALSQACGEWGGRYYENKLMTARMKR